MNPYEQIDSSGKIVLVDFQSCNRALRAYGGNAGAKESIIWNDCYWMIKFPQSTATIKGDIRSYTTSPISEWLGSHIYEAAGIPVHDTVLGILDGKVIVACRDFTSRDKDFINFHDIKNTPASDEKAPDGGESSGSTVYLSDVLRSISTNRFLQPIRKEVEERFWDMFCIDALIGNTDRNNENWGIFINPKTEERSLAPVYDNGNSFFNKRKDSKNEQDLADPSRLKASAISNLLSVYLSDDGNQIHPFSYLATTSDPACIEAIARTARNVDLSEFKALVDMLPLVATGRDVVPKLVADFYKAVLEERFNAAFSPEALTKNHPSLLRGN